MHAGLVVGTQRVKVGQNKFKRLLHGRIHFLTETQLNSVYESKINWIVLH